VVVVGGGPAGAAAAYWLARAGVRTLVLEKKLFPRSKTCGDGLTPRSVTQLDDMGLGAAMDRFHRVIGLRAVAADIELELAWPRHPVFPQHGYVAPRSGLDRLVLDNAQEAGAEVWQGAEVVNPLTEGTRIVGLEVKDKSSGTTRLIEPDYVVLADGANSRVGRALGHQRDRRYPLGLALRSHYTSELHDDGWIESHINIKDARGRTLPGYGWIFPVGDGTVNIGIGVVSTYRHWKTVNTTELLNSFVEVAPERWGVDVSRATCAPTGGRLPMGGAVSPKFGRNYLVVGDAAGAINPFNGEGIAYGYETGRMAAGLLMQALGGGDSRCLLEYPQMLETTYGSYFRVARLMMRLIGMPFVLHRLAAIGMQSQTLMEWALRVMCNLVRPDERKPAEMVLKMLERIVDTASHGPEPIPQDLLREFELEPGVAAAAL
jgi:geranylgeranyl reductase family protein